MTRKSAKVVRSTPTSNIPILVTQDYMDGSNNDVIYLFKNNTTGRSTTYGIFAPFEGVFLLRVHQTIPSSGQLDRQITIKVDNIYGEARTLYRGDTVVTVGNLNAGCYLCHFDTDERRLYLVQ